MVVDGEGVGIERRAADGEPGVRRGEGGEEDELAEVFPADAADGGEEDGGGEITAEARGREGRGGEGNWIGEEGGVFGRESGVGEECGGRGN